MPNTAKLAPDLPAGATRVVPTSPPPATPAVVDPNVTGLTEAGPPLDLTGAFTHLYGALGGLVRGARGLVTTLPEKTQEKIEQTQVGREAAAELRRQLEPRNLMLGVATGEVYGPEGEAVPGAARLLREARRLDFSAVPGHADVTLPMDGGQFVHPDGKVDEVATHLSHALYNLDKDQLSSEERARLLKMWQGLTSPEEPIGLYMRQTGAVRIGYGGEWIGVEALRPPTPAQVRHVSDLMRETGVSAVYHLPGGVEGEALTPVDFRKAARQSAKATEADLNRAVPAVRAPKARGYFGFGPRPERTPLRGGQSLGRIDEIKPGTLRLDPTQDDAAFWINSGTRQVFKAETHGHPLVMNQRRLGLDLDPKEIHQGNVDEEQLAADMTGTGIIRARLWVSGPQDHLTFSALGIEDAQDFNAVQDLVARLPEGSKPERVFINGTPPSAAFHTRTNINLPLREFQGSSFEDLIDRYGKRNFTRSAYLNRALPAEAAAEVSPAEEAAPRGASAARAYLTAAAGGQRHGAITKVAARLNAVPVDPGVFQFPVTLELRSDPETVLRTGLLGRYSASQSKIVMLDGSPNTLAHEWAHHLDHKLVPLVTQVSPAAAAGHAAMRAEYEREAKRAATIVNQRFGFTGFTGFTTPSVEETLRSGGQPPPDHGWETLERRLEDVYKVGGIRAARPYSVANFHEWFATSVEEYLKNRFARARLRRLAPATHDFVEKLLRGEHGVAPAVEAGAPGGEKTLLNREVTAPPGETTITDLWRIQDRLRTNPARARVMTRDDPRDLERLYRSREGDLDALLAGLRDLGRGDLRGDLARAARGLAAARRLFHRDGDWGAAVAEQEAAGDVLHHVLDYISPTGPQER